MRKQHKKNPRISPLLIRGFFYSQNLRLITVFSIL